VRRPAAPTLLAWAAALVGVVGIVSGLTPELASRSDLVRGLLPPGVPDAARTLAVALGLALIWLSRGLARRKRRAWQLAIALVVASGAAHLAKGLDFEEAVVSLVVVCALWRARREFVAPGDATSIRPLLQALTAMTALGVLALVSSGDTVGDALELVAGALAVRALYLWLRPIAERTLALPADRAQAERIVRAHGSDSLAYFALRRDKALFFSASGRSFLAYRVVGGTAIVSGDPIGDRAELRELVSEFRRVARAKGWRVAVAGVPAETLREYAELGFRAMYVGDEAVVEPQAFSLEGRPIRKVRQSVTRLRRRGYRVDVLEPAGVDDALRAQLCALSAEWRGNAPERGFTMAMDGLWSYEDALLAVARDGTGRVGGFLQLVPAPAIHGWSLAAMRRRRDSPNGLMEFLVAETILWAGGRGASELSLNFAVFGEYLRAEGGLLRTLLLRLDRLFQLERLHGFSRKFFPTWRRRYLCFERWPDFPCVALAYLHAESLLTPPGPWVRTEDLAAR
jgi:lysyl-tRNA synthetase, class II